MKHGDRVKLPDGRTGTIRGIYPPLPPDEGKPVAEIDIDGGQYPLSNRVWADPEVLSALKRERKEDG